MLAKLRAEDGTNDPVNDLLDITVGPLDEGDAVDLARRLFIGEELDVPDPEATATHLVNAVDRIPYYVHHVVKGLCGAESPIDATEVDRVVETSLTSGQDPWRLRYYDDRLDDDFGANADAVRSILDTIASVGPVSLGDLANAVASRHQPAAGEESVRRWLRLLESDHYLVTDGNGRSRFTYPLIGRAWRIQRKLP